MEKNKESQSQKVLGYSLSSKLGNNRSKLQVINPNLSNKKRKFLKPGKNNQEELMNFVIFWADYMKSVSDKEWSKQQNFLINSLIPNLEIRKLSV